MANRALLHRSRLTAFKAWLGERNLMPRGEWEVARWRGPRGKPMCIVYDNRKSSEHLSCNNAAVGDVREFIRIEKLKVRSW